jgi:8-oxo-dGTP diphosphatase
MDTMIVSYNLRVYGLLIVDNQILLTDEYRAGMIMTKFPGGGLEKGEGLADCLIREFEEELAISIEVGKLYYVNEFLQVSAFNSSQQLISFYYIVETKERDLIPAPIDLTELKVNEQRFRWVNLNDLDPTTFTFPIDQKVAELLRCFQKK